MKPGNLRGAQGANSCGICRKMSDYNPSSRFSRGVLFCHEKQNGRILRTAMLDGEYETEVHFL